MGAGTELSTRSCSRQVHLGRRHSESPSRLGRQLSLRYSRQDRGAVSIFQPLQRQAFERALAFFPGTQIFTRLPGDCDFAETNSRRQLGLPCLQNDPRPKVEPHLGLRYACGLRQVLPFETRHPRRMEMMPSARISEESPAQRQLNQTIPSRAGLRCRSVKNMASRVTRHAS